MFAEDNPSDAAVNQFYYSKANTELKGSMGVEDTVKGQIQRIQESMGSTTPLLGHESVDGTHYDNSGQKWWKMENLNGEIQIISQGYTKQELIDMGVMKIQKLDPGSLLANKHLVDGAFKDIGQNIRNFTSDLAKGVGQLIGKTLEGAADGVPVTVWMVGAAVVVLVLRRG